jgi:hypothetical protein
MRQVRLPVLEVKTVRSAKCCHVTILSSLNTETGHSFIAIRRDFRPDNRQFAFDATAVVQSRTGVHYERMHAWSANRCASRQLVIHSFLGTVLVDITSWSSVAAALSFLYPADGAQVPACGRPPHGPRAL